MGLKTRKGKTYTVTSLCGELNITLNRGKQGDIIECFVRAGKAGSCISAINEALGRLISLHLRKNGNIKDVIRELANTQCNQSFSCNKVKYTSCIDVIGKSLQKEEQADKNGNP